MSFTHYHEGEYSDDPDSWLPHDLVTDSEEEGDQCSEKSEDSIEPYTLRFSSSPWEDVHHDIDLVVKEVQGSKCLLEPTVEFIPWLPDLRRLELSAFWTIDAIPINHKDWFSATKLSEEKRRFCKWGEHACFILTAFYRGQDVYQLKVQIVVDASAIHYPY